MKESLIVRGAPQQYICEEGAWNHIESHLIGKNIEKVLILHGEKSWQVAESFFPKMTQVTTYFEHYRDECSFENAAYFEKIVEKNQIKAVIAIGGGKVLDLGKLVANNCLIDIICLPTLASTCAAYTPISIVYNDKGEMVEMKFLKQSVTLTLVDPAIILNSPTEFLIAGIGDTIAKWYESDPIISSIEKPVTEILVAKFAAKSCQENLLTFGQEAISDLANQTLSYALINVIETNILLAGMVGGFADKYGRSSGAHSIHDALTLIEATHSHLHGNKVAYGILVQLAIEEKWTEIEKLTLFYEELNLPYKLAHLDLTINDVNIVAEVAANDELFHQLPQVITKEIVKEAMLALEN